MPVIIQIRYVDAYRGMAVQLGGQEFDLKEAIDLSGLASLNATDSLTGVNFFNH